MIFHWCLFSLSTSLYWFHKHFLFLDPQFFTAIDSFYREDVIIQLSGAVFIKAAAPPTLKWECVLQKTALFYSSCTLFYSPVLCSPHNLLVSVICISSGVKHAHQLTETAGCVLISTGVHSGTCQLLKMQVWFYFPFLHRCWFLIEQKYTLWMWLIYVETCCSMKS